MTDSEDKTKVIPITRGTRRSPAARTQARGVAISPGTDSDATREMLSALHPRVRAVLVARRGKWEYFERIRSGENSRSVLQDVALPELLAMLQRSRVEGQVGQRITISPWPGFDLAVLLRDGKPCYAACFDPDTSIYIAEATLPELAGYFDRLNP